MLQTMDRVVLVAPDAAAAAAGWEDILGAEPEAVTESTALGATCHRWRLGDGRVEILTPAGTGVVADALEARGAHLFAGGFTTDDMAAFTAHLSDHGIEPLRDGGRVLLDAARCGVPGMCIFVDEHRPPPGRVGLIDTFYETSVLVPDADDATARTARLLGIDPAEFVPITSKPYGYSGALTLFHPDRLDRLEVITPNRPGTTMDRFYQRAGDSLYMCFAESAELAEIERRATAAGAGFTAVPEPEQRDALGAHTLFLHPRTLGGMMLGLSRRSYAWTWSGHPERVEGAR